MRFEQGTISAVDQRARLFATCVVVVSLVGACGKSETAPPGGSPVAGEATTPTVTPATPSAVTPATPSTVTPATPAAVTPATPSAVTPTTPAAGPVAATCESACAHRQACGVAGDVTGCTRDCNDLTATIGADQLAPYVAMACPDVLAAERDFSYSVACQKACARRAACLPEGKDQRACFNDCAGLAVLLGDESLPALSKYSGADCSVVVQEEPEFRTLGTCVRGCKRVLECGVVGTYPACFVECAQNLKAQRYTLADIERLLVTDCETVKRTVTVTPLAAGNDGGSSGRGDIFRRNPRFPMCNSHDDCAGTITNVCCRQQFHSSCVSACY